MPISKAEEAQHAEAAAIAQDCGPVPQSFGDKQIYLNEPEVGRSSWRSTESIRATTRTLLHKEFLRQLL